MIYESILPLLVTMLVMAVALTYLAVFEGDFLHTYRELSNDYLLSINVLSGLNRTMGRALNDASCILLKESASDCGDLARVVVDEVNELLGRISNEAAELGYPVRYRIISAKVVELHNETMLMMSIEASVNGKKIRGNVSASVSVRLCTVIREAVRLSEMIREGISVESRGDVGNDINNRLVRIIDGGNGIGARIDYLLTLYPVIQGNETVYMGTMYFNLLVRDEWGIGECTVSEVKGYAPVTVILHSNTSNGEITIRGSVA